MASVQVYVEIGVGMAYRSGAAAWVFDPRWWGVCGQGTHEGAALDDLRDRLEPGATLVPTERIHGDEGAFARDRVACTEEERALTQAVLDEVRPQTMAVLAQTPPEHLDWDDPERILPPFATWRTARELAWHIADTESRYYLPSLGLPARPRAASLAEELVSSAAHVRAQVAGMPADLVVRRGSEEWTSTKVLRRLAWHERGELAVMRALVAKAARALGRPG